jgi:nicotinamidase-related amidase
LPITRERSQVTEASDVGTDDDGDSKLQPSRRSPMASEPVRDPVTDHLLTPRNCVLAIVDYQPIPVQSVKSVEHEQLVDNVVRVAETATTYGVPIVLSTVNVSTGANKPTIAPLMDVLPGVAAIDRTTMNSWEDLDFKRAVEATGRKKLVMAALWTEVCLTFPLLDAMREGYDVYPVVDAVGGTSAAAHRAGLARLAQAGAQPVSWVQFACELQRDWSRAATVTSFKELVFGHPAPPLVASSGPATASRGSW